MRDLGEQNASIFQDRVNQVLGAAIRLAVQHGSTYVTGKAPITVDTKNWMVDIAVKYAVEHAPDLMTEAGNVTEKVLARFDLHPAVQALVSPTPPVEPVTARN